MTNSVASRTDYGRTPAPGSTHVSSRSPGGRAVGYWVIGLTIARVVFDSNGQILHLSGINLNGLIAIAACIAAMPFAFRTRSSLRLGLIGGSVLLYGALIYTFHFGYDSSLQGEVIRYWSVISVCILARSVTARRADQATGWLVRIGLLIACICALQQAITLTQSSEITHASATLVHPNSAGLFIAITLAIAYPRHNAANRSTPRLHLVILGAGLLATGSISAGQRQSLESSSSLHLIQEWPAGVGFAGRSSSS